MRQALERLGHDVYGVDILRGYDALDFFRTTDRPYDLVVHCAAVIGGRAGIDGSPLAVATNLALDSWFFRWLELSGTPRAVYFSSSAVYPATLQNAAISGPLQLEEAMRQPYKLVGLPDATYGWCKLTGEQLAEHARKDGRQVLVVRPFSGYGPDQSLDYPFPSFIRRAALREDPFEIWGDGEQVRDWVHIEDVVGAVLALLEADEEGPVNIGTGRATSFNELAGLIFDAMGDYRPAIKHLPSQPSGVSYRVADPARLHDFYRPSISLEAGIQEALSLAIWQAGGS